MRVDAPLEEAEALGRNRTGRPHFAELMVRKGYAASVRDAFDRYLGESAAAYVPRRTPPFSEVAARIEAAGGISVVAHPYRLGRKEGADPETLIEEMAGQGLRGIEAYYSEHDQDQVRRFLGLAHRLGLAVSGGSDFHGSAKPGIALGAGPGGLLTVPREVLESLREHASRKP